MPLNTTALIIFVLLFALITIMGFVAGRWRRGDRVEVDLPAAGEIRMTVRRARRGPFQIARAVGVLRNVLC